MLCSKYSLSVILNMVVLLPVSDKLFINLFHIKYYTHISAPLCFSANCLSVGEEFVFIGCAEGIVRCFSPHTLQFVTTLPRTHYLGVDVSKGLTISHMASHPNNAQYPDASAVSYDEQNGRVSVVYNDHSLYIWDVHDIRKVNSL